MVDSLRANRGFPSRSARAIPTCIHVGEYRVSRRFACAIGGARCPQRTLASGLRESRPLRPYASSCLWPFPLSKTAHRRGWLDRRRMVRPCSCCTSVRAPRTTHQRHQANPQLTGYKSRATRNPTRALRELPSTPCRYAESTCSGELPQEPPRTTWATQPGFSHALPSVGART